ncbi:hypothetical protein SLE2022_374760 [Rubroshorea leprosula]
MLGEKNNTAEFGDTTYTKIFAGGLAWETKSDSLKRYFQQFGEILEAVVITDKSSGRSKGYGFVTFKDADSARKACQIPYPVIDGRRANCNLACLGAKNRPINLNPPQYGMEKWQPWTRSPASSSPIFRQPIPPYGFPYTAAAHGYPAPAGYTVQDQYAMNYYTVYGGQQPPSHNRGGSGVYLNYYPFYPQQAQNSPTQYPKVVQYPFWPQQYGALGTFPASVSSPSFPVTMGQMPVAAVLPGTNPRESSTA